MTSSYLRGLCKVLSGLSLLVGALGMMMSFLYLATSSDMADITTGSAGFVAGAILLGSGVISLSLVASAQTRHLKHHAIDDDIVE